MHWAMNVYDVITVAGPTREIRAGLCQREADDVVFLTDGAEVFRIPASEVARIAKSKTWGSRPGDAEEELSEHLRL